MQKLLLKPEQMTQLKLKTKRLTTEECAWCLIPAEEPRESAKWSYGGEEWTLLNYRLTRDTLELQLFAGLAIVTVRKCRSTPRKPEALRSGSRARFQSYGG